jgi:predicted O-methyltransferase YrrM
LFIDKVKKGGLIIADNVLWTGKVVDPESHDDDLTKCLIDFNKMIAEDNRVENIILPLRDGLNIILKN